MSGEDVNLDKPPVYITIGSGIIGGGSMGLVLLDMKGLYIGVLLGFITGLLFYIHNRVFVR